MAGLCVAVIVLIAAIVLVVVRNNTPLNPMSTKNLTIPEKTLRESASAAFADLRVTTTPRQTFLEKIDFENEWIFLKAIAANIATNNPSRTLYVILKKDGHGNLQLIAYSTGKEAWQTTSGNTLPDNARERARKLWNEN
jgi:hypothetical protein